MNKKIAITVIGVLFMIIAIVIICFCLIPKESNQLEKSDAVANINEETNSTLIINNKIANEVNENTKDENDIKDIENIEDTKSNTENNKETEVKISENKQNNNKQTNNNSSNIERKTSNKTTNTTNKNTNKKLNTNNKKESERQETQQEQSNTKLANKHFTKQNEEKTAQAVSYLNNLIKSQSDYDEFGGYAVAVTSKPTNNWFSYSEYKLNGFSLSRYIVKVYIEDEYRYNSKGTSYYLYDTKAYIYQEILN